LTLAAVKRAGLGLLGDDAPALGFFTHEGDTQVGLSVIENEPALNMYGSNRTEVAVVVGRTNQPYARILGARRQLLWQAP